MANAVDLCLGSVVAADLGVTEDATVARVVTAASRLIARRCGRVFEKATGIVEYPANFGRALLMLDRAPILSVASITEGGSAVASTEYEIHADDGMLLRLGGNWLRTVRLGGNIADTVDQALGSADGIVVTYAAGYVTPWQNVADAQLVVTVPEDLQEAAITLATALHRRRGRDAELASEAIGDWSAAYRAVPGQILTAVDELLAPYRLQRGG